MATPEFDEHILSTMTDEERATILEVQTPEELAAIAAIASGAEDGPDDDDDDDDDDDLDGDDGAAAAAAAAAAVADAGAAPAPKADAGAPAEAPATTVFQPTYQAKLPDDFAAQETAIKDQTEALAAKFKGGDIDFDQYRVEAEALSRQERALDEVRLKATLSQEMTSQSVEQQWGRTVQTFIAATAKSNGIDYRTDKDKGDQFDFYVRALANDPKHADKPGEWFLSEAHKVVMTLNGLGLVKAPAAVDPKANRKTPLDAAPKTLAQVPGGDGPGDVDGNEFSDIDRLTGDAQEAAIAKMTPAQRDRYMAGG